MRKEGNTGILNMTQVLVWAFVILMPAALSWSIAGNTENAVAVFKGTIMVMAPVLFLYLVNYFWLVPKYLFGKDRKWFYIINAGFLILINIRSFFPEPVPEEFRTQMSESLPFTVNDRFPSFIRVRMSSDGPDFDFTCENSVFDKAASDHIGSGIGIENLRRRLELLYPDAFEYSSGNDGRTYTATVRLKGILR